MRRNFTTWWRCNTKCPAPSKRSRVLLKQTFSSKYRIIFERASIWAIIASLVNQLLTNRIMYHFIPAHFSPPDLAHFSPLNCIVSSTQRAHFSPPNSTHFIPNGNFSIAKKHQKMKSESEFECARLATFSQP